jgi:hypothetical protein
MNAKLQTIKAETSKTGPTGRIWSAGIHHVFVDEKPARVHVPQYTVLDTFKKLTNKINGEGSVRFGVDHLPTSLYKDNQILAKMNLDNVGEISKVVYDGESIYIQNSELTNKEIQRLHDDGELPAYSIVGAMEASPCPTDRADYVVDNIVIDRVDFVEEGGCQECKTGVEPGQILITSKKSKEADSMVEEEQKDEKVDNVEGESKPESEAPKTDDVEQKDEEEEVKEEVKEVEQEPEEKESEDDEISSNDLIQELRDEVKELRKVVDGKKPKPVAAKVSEDTKEIVEHLIQAGKATPAMKTPLQQLAASNPEAFKEYSEQLDKVVDFSVKSKLAPVKEKQEEELSVDEVLTAMGRKDLVKE